MRHIILSALLACAAALATPTAGAVEIHVHHADCGFSSSYDVFVKPDGVRFSREEGSPQQVFIHDGALRIDGQPVAVNAGDARRLRQFEGDVRTIMPQMAAIAREGVEIGFDAVTTVAATLSSDPAQRQQLVKRLNARHAEALRRIDATLGQGELRQDALKDVIEGSVRDTVPALVGTVTAEALKAALSGDHAQLAALQARADSLDTSIDREVNARADKLSARAEAMCPRLRELHHLQQAWAFRTPSGQPLQLIEPEHDHTRVND